jgi:rhamnopyranosyl-N-acetylglucosaminyl-diphospho-decaprenol beta-1,3/1,4-galactofuranosyltransferase
VVTRDRRDLLRQSLAAVAAQTRPVDRIVVVDNASSDGTGEMLAADFPQAQVVALAENAGATGGFYAGIEAGMAAGAEWLWLLDDDCFPSDSALEGLLAALDRVQGDRPALLGSRVEWRDGGPHPMNMPTIARRDPALLAAAASAGLLPLRATTWVSLLLSREAVEREGMPIRHFFYQADDIEYTARILRRATGYFVPQSVVEHRTPSKQTWTSDERRFYYHARNTVLMLRGGAWAPGEKPALAWTLLTSSIEYLRLNRWSSQSARTLARGLADGLTSPAA